MTDVDSVKQWVAGAVLACLVVLAAAWFLLISPTRSEAADLTAQAESQAAANATLRTRLRQLQEQAEQLPAQEAALARIAEKVPADAGYPDLVRALDDLATRTGVDLVTLTPGVPGAAPGQPAAAAPAPAPAAPAAEGAAPAPAPAPAPGAAGAAGAAGTPAWQPMPLSMTVYGGFYDLQAFLAGLEELSRAVRVTALQVAPGASPVLPPSTGPAVEDGSSLSATITAEAYVSAATAPQETS